MAVTYISGAGSNAYGSTQKLRRIFDRVGSDVMVKTFYASLRSQPLRREFWPSEGTHPAVRATEQYQRTPKIAIGSGRASQPSRA